MVERAPVSLINPRDPDSDYLLFLAHADTSAILAFSIIGSLFQNEIDVVSPASVRDRLDCTEEELTDALGPLLEAKLFKCEDNNLVLTPAGVSALKVMHSPVAV